MIRKITREELIDSLNRTDILLTRSRKGITGRLIRKATGSRWNHVALVYVIRHLDLGFNNTFIIESGGQGVDIHKIEVYLPKEGDRYRNDVGVKRLEKPWFAGDDDEKALSIRRMVRGHLLDCIDATYDYGMLLRIGKRIMQKALLGPRWALRRLRPSKRPLGKTSTWEPLEVICSGFAQLAYYHTVKLLTEMPPEDDLHLPRECLEDVMFNPQLENGEFDPATLREVLLSTTPADFARTDKLNWKFIFKDGHYYSVDSGEDVDQLMRKG